MVARAVLVAPSTAISTLARERSVVGTVTSHGTKVAETLALRTQRRGHGDHRKRTPRLGLEAVLELLSLVAGAEFDDDAGLDTLELASCLFAVGDFGTLDDGVEGLEVQESDSSAGPGRVAESRDGGGIDASDSRYGKRRRRGG